MADCAVARSPIDMGNSVLAACCGSPKTLADLKSAPYQPAGMDRPIPALPILRRDVAAAQLWIDTKIEELNPLEIEPQDEPPGGDNEHERIKNIEEIKKVHKEFCTQSLDIEDLLKQCYEVLALDKHEDTVFDLNVERLKFTWSLFREKLQHLARQYNSEELNRELGKDFFIGEHKDYHFTKRPPVKGQRVPAITSSPDTATNGRKPKKKRKYVPHLTWQYRAVIKSHVKYRARSQRSSAVGSYTSSEAGSVVDGPVYKRAKDLSASDRDISYLSGYSDINSNHLISPEPTKQQDQTISIVKCPSSGSELDTETISVQLANSNTVTSTLEAVSRLLKRSLSDQEQAALDDSDGSSTPIQQISPPPEDNMASASENDPEKINPQKLLGGMTRSRGIHENLTGILSERTPLKADHSISAVTPSFQFFPPDMSTPLPAQPQTPVEIRRCFGTSNNSGVFADSTRERFSPDGNHISGYDGSSNSSNMSSLTQSPTGESHKEFRRDLKKKYKKDELWRAIKSDYHYLMDDDIIEQCRSTDSDLSWDDEEAKNAVSFTDFIQQYNELMEWLNQIQMFTQRQGSSLSEKYLNQSYYEEMLDRSPRRKLFNDYAKQLMRRYPNMKDEISVRLQHLNSQWESLQKAVAPSDGLRDRGTMLRDLRLDLRGLESWVQRIESSLQPMLLAPNLSLKKLIDKLTAHQVLQSDIECHSKVVSAVLKLCERLSSDADSPSSQSEELQLTALNLESRWHAIWLQSLEWQCRLEEAIGNRKGLLGRSYSQSNTEASWDSTIDQSESAIDETGSQISQVSTVRSGTVTKNRSTSPITDDRVSRGQGCSPLHFDEGTRELVEVDTEDLFLQDADVYLTFSSDDLSTAHSAHTVHRPAEGRVRHWSGGEERHRNTGSVSTNVPAAKRPRRYSDSAHNFVDSPGATPPLRAKSLSDLDKLIVSQSEGSACSLEQLSDDSDELFDETAKLLETVASELRTYEEVDDDDEFFLYNKCRINQLEQTQSDTETGLESVIEEEFESDMSSPTRRRYSPGEKVFASPKVKQFLKLQSFSSTISPSGTPPNGRSAADAEFEVREGNISFRDGKLQIDNVALADDISQLSPDAITVITRLSSGASTPTGALIRGRRVYSVEQHDSHLNVELSPRAGTDQLACSNTMQAGEYDYYDSTDESSELYAPNSGSLQRGKLYIQRYGPSEDLSKLAAGSDTSDVDLDDSRRSLSPTDLITSRWKSDEEDSMSSRLLSTQRGTDVMITPTTDGKQTFSLTFESKEHPFFTVEGGSMTVTAQQKVEKHEEVTHRSETVIMRGHSAGEEHITPAVNQRISKGFVLTTPNSEVPDANVGATVIGSIHQLPPVNIRSVTTTSLSTSGTTTPDTRTKQTSSEHIDLSKPTQPTDKPLFSVLKGQETLQQGLAHSHDGFDKDVGSIACWEKDVGLPANWSTMHVDSTATAEHCMASNESTKASDETYETVIMTPSQKYLKVTSREDNEDYSETIYINQTEMTKSASLCSVTPSEGSMTASECDDGIADRTVRGVQEIHTNIQPVSKARKSLIGKLELLSGTPKSQVKVRSGSLTSTSGRKQEYQREEFTTVLLHSQRVHNDVPPEAVALSSQGRYTAEANVSFSSADPIPHTAEKLSSQLILQSAKLPVSESGEVKTTILSRQRPSDKLSAAAQPQLHFDVSSTIVSEEDGTDVDKKRCPATVMYRILDNGDVVCEGDEKRTALKAGNGERTTPTALTEDHIFSETKTLDALTTQVATTPNDSYPLVSVAEVTVSEPLEQVLTVTNSLPKHRVNVSVTPSNQLGAMTNMQEVTSSIEASTPSELPAVNESKQPVINRAEALIMSGVKPDVSTEQQTVSQAHVDDSELPLECAELNINDILMRNVDSETIVKESSTAVVTVTQSVGIVNAVSSTGGLEAHVNTVQSLPESITHAQVETIAPTEEVHVTVHQTSDDELQSLVDAESSKEWQPVSETESSAAVVTVTQSVGIVNSVSSTGGLEAHMNTVQSLPESITHAQVETIAPTEEEHVTVHQTSDDELQSLVDAESSEERQPVRETVIVTSYKPREQVETISTLLPTNVAETSVTSILPDTVITTNARQASKDGTQTRVEENAQASRKQLIEQHRSINLHSAGDSDAFDGDESSEGDQDSSTDLVKWPPASPSKDVITSQMYAKTSQLDLSPFHDEDTGERSPQESGFDTPHQRKLLEPTREDSPDHKTTPVRKRRRRRARTHEESGIEISSQNPDDSPSPPASHMLPLTLDLQTTNENAADSTDRLSDGPTSDSWDYYHHELYSVEPEGVSLEEEKLDDSMFQWDDEMDDENSTVLFDHSNSPLGAAGVHSESEDSDIEDLHYVIQQSSTQLRQADSALRKPRRDVVQSGIYLDPQKYIEWHATCQTNIKCLQVIQEHLDSEQGLPNLTDDDIQQVLDLIKKWQTLEQVALERKGQSLSLCKIYKDLTSVKKLLTSCEQQSAITAFNDVSEVESHFRTLQTFRASLHAQPHKLQQINDEVMVFESANKKIKMNGFKQLLSELNSAITPALQMLQRRTIEIPRAIILWNKWNTACKELESSLLKTAFDIETVELSVCEERLVSLETSLSEFSVLCTEVAHNDIEEKLSSLRVRLDELLSEQKPGQTGSPHSGLLTPVSTDEPITEELPTNEQQITNQLSVRGSAMTIPVSMDEPITEELPTIERPITDQLLVKDSEMTESGLNDLGVVPITSDHGLSSAESGFATMDTEHADMTLYDEPFSLSDISSSHQPITAGPQSLELSKSSNQPITKDDRSEKLKSKPGKKGRRGKRRKRGNRKDELEGSNLPVLEDIDLPEPEPFNTSADHSTNTAPLTSDSMLVQTEPSDELLKPSYVLVDSNESSTNKPDDRSSVESQTDDMKAILRRNAAETEDTSTDDITSQDVNIQTEESKSTVDRATTTGDTDLLVTSSMKDLIVDDPAADITSQDVNIRTKYSKSTVDQATTTGDTDLLVTPSMKDLIVDDPAADITSQDVNIQTEESKSTVDQATTTGDTDLLVNPSMKDLIVDDPAADIMSQDVNIRTEDSKSTVDRATTTHDADLLVTPPVKDLIVDDPADELDTCNSNQVETNLDFEQPLIVPIVDLFADEEGYITQMSTEVEPELCAQLQEEAVKPEPVEAKSIPKQKGKKIWQRSLRYLYGITGALLLLAALLFILEPKCCENSVWHKGIYGLRRRYTELPPH